MRTIGLTVLLEMELPGGDVRLCSGAWFDFGGERYFSAHPLWGAVGHVEMTGEGVGDAVPALQMRLLPPGTTTPADMHPAGMQGCAVRWWTAEYDAATGLIDEGTAELEFVGRVDQCTLEAGEEERVLAMSHVPDAEVLFERDIGNSMNPTFHKLCFPGELGHDEATGLAQAEAWGAATPAAQQSRAQAPLPRGGPWREVPI